MWCVWSLLDNWAILKKLYNLIQSWPFMILSIHRIPRKKNKSLLFTIWTNISWKTLAQDLLKTGESFQHNQKSEVSVWKTWKAKFCCHCSNKAHSKLTASYTSWKKDPYMNREPRVFHLCNRWDFSAGTEFTGGPLASVTCRPPGRLVESGIIASSFQS